MIKLLTSFFNAPSIEDTTFISVQTYYGTVDGWRERTLRSQSSAFEFYRILKKIEDNRIHRLALV